MCHFLLLYNQYYSASCMQIYMSTHTHTHIYAGCLNWLLGVHSLYWDTLLSFDMSGLGLASTWCTKFCWLSKGGLTSSEEWWEMGWSKLYGQEKGNEGNRYLYIKFKKNKNDKESNINPNLKNHSMSTECLVQTHAATIITTLIFVILHEPNSSFCGSCSSRVCDLSSS